MGRNTEHRFWKLSRASGQTPNVVTLVQRARSFSAAVGNLGPVTLLAVRGDAGIENFLVTPQGQAAQDAAVHLAHALAARADQTATPPELNAPVIGWLCAVEGSVTRDTQAGVDPSELARGVARIMRPDSWIGVSVRGPKRKEIRRSQKWYQFRLGQDLPTHHAFDDGTVVVSVFAGGRTKDEVKSLLQQTAAMMPGFDVTTKVKIASAMKPVAISSFLSLGAFGGVLYATKDWLLANLAGGVPAATSVGFASGALPSTASRLAIRTRDGVLPSPEKRTFRPRKPRKGERTAVPGTRAADGQPGSYPLDSSSFLVGPTVAIGIVAPHAGATSGMNVNEVREVPAAMTKRVGPMIGRGGSENRPVFLSAKDAFAGTALFGAPGTGKSWLVHALWGWATLDRVEPSGLPGAPGERNAMIAFESKGADGSEVYKRWSDLIGDKAVVVDMMDPSTPAIDLLAVPGTTVQKAEWFTDAMVYAFNDGAIQGRSVESLQSCMTGGLVVTDEIAKAADLPRGRGPVFYCYILLGGQGDPAGLKLATEIGLAAEVAEKAARKEQMERGPRALGSGEPRDEGRDADEDSGPLTDLGEAVNQLAVIYGTTGGKVTEAQRRTLTEAARNKMKQLGSLDVWWRSDRRKVTWDEVLTNHRSIIVNAGTSSQNIPVDQGLLKLMSALLMFSLKAAIERNCSGWQAQGRSVSIFADELSYLAGSGPEVLTFLRNQGRSFGVRPVFATQYPEQLDQHVRTAVTGFGTLMAFSQQDPNVVSSLVADLALNGEEWSTSDIAGMERYSSALRTTMDGQRQPTLTVRVEPFEEGLMGPDGDKTVQRFREAQGWS